MGLALRWARAGHDIVIGSRDVARAVEKAAEGSRIAGVHLGGAGNDDAARHGEVVLLSVPYGAHAETLRSIAPSLAGRILVDITVPLKPPAITRVTLPPGQAAALEAQQIVGQGVRVVAGFHHVSAVHLLDLEHALDCDVLVCGDDVAARDVVIALAKDLGTRGIDAGPLQNAIALESLTPVLLHINRRYKVAGAGIRFTGLGG